MQVGKSAPSQVEAEHVIVSTREDGSLPVWWTGTRLGWSAYEDMAHRYASRDRAAAALLEMRQRRQCNQQRRQSVIPASQIDRIIGRVTA